MKKIIYKITFVITFLLISNLCWAQLPLQFGDGVITHSPDSYTASGPSTSPAVLRVVHTANTSSAPLGATWNIPTKPANDFYPNWNVNTLGYIFGITLDQNNNPNIYVSSTQIYSSSTVNQRKIWRINGNTGANSLVYDFNNITGMGTVTSKKSLGNLKYLKLGVVENIYVSDWETGTIQRVTGNTTTASLWSVQNDFNPLFGKSIKDKAEMPYGIALRKMASGAYRLYYAKVSTNNNSNNFGAYGNNEIWFVDLDPSGGFIAGTETNANIPNINRPPGSWGGYSGSGISYNCSTLPVIADIAFTSDGKKMLVGQQTWGNFGILAPHNSEVKEFIDLSGTWANAPNLFPAGIFTGITCSTPAASKNSVGGVSYSSNILQKSGTSFACDTTVWFTADYINIGSGNTVYGLQGMNANGGASNSSTNAIWIDADDNLAFYDKTFLGDVEIYKNPASCAPPCECGTWNSIGINRDTKWWVNDATAGHLASPVPTLTFNQGQSTGVIFPNYNCNGNCNTTFNYQIVKIDGTIAGNWTTNSLDLGQDVIKNLPCGNYTIVITPHCGSNTCPPLQIRLIIVCPPPCPTCNSETTIKTDTKPVITIANNIGNANPISTINANLVITNSITVTQVRVLVDEFRVYSATGNENCLLCKNPPKAWGSFQAGTLSGVTLQTALNNALTHDIRELVFNNGVNTTFSLSPGKPFNFTLALPGVTGLDCCNLKVDICLKFTIRDINCCEKEVLKCFTFNLQ
jgi:hypothetical protein